MKRYLLLLGVQLIFFLDSYSTNQVKDILLYNGDTLYFYDSPLKQYSEELSKIDLNREFSTDCWRGYRAEWVIKNDSLFLSNVYDCNSEKNLNKYLEDILDREFAAGLIKADWVNNEYWCGKDLVPEQTLYISIYKQEYLLTFQEGNLKELTKYHFKPCQYNNEKKWTEFIISNMDWTGLAIPENKDLKFSVYIEPNSNGEISLISIEHSDDSRYNSEVTKAISQLPCMTIYFNEGKLWDVGQNINFTINKQNIKKYVR